MTLDDSSLKVAEFLLQIKAIKLQPGKPFTWASGLKSPIYCDNRKTLSYPKIRTFIRQQLVHGIQEHFGNPEVIAGVATAGIPQGVLVAQDLGLPFIYVRPEPKGHGLGNQIEGHFEPGQEVVLVEDLISTGKSSLKAAKALREAGCHVKGMIAIFSYEFDEARENMEKEKVELVTLSGYSTLIQKAVQSGYVNEKDLKSLESWRINPKEWSEKNKK